MNLIEDTAEGFVAIPVRRPRPFTLYKLGDGEDGTMRVIDSARLASFIPDRFYRGYAIEYDPPPIPDRRFDYSFVHHDYGGPGDPRCGRARSVEEAKSEIDMLYEDEGD